ncbi:MAG: nucleotide exchange factor GrpE [Lachnospiraceae bacterium]|nr:nucleotide exchange factor GrpE [Lachnospiraceae bacterium]
MEAGENLKDDVTKDTTSEESTFEDALKKAKEEAVANGEVTEEELKANEEKVKEAENEKIQPKASKTERKHKKKDKRDEQIEDLTDKLKRQMAEFDNFRKRTEKEKSGMFDLGAKSVVEKILPVIDNFERGFDALSDEEKKEPFAEGMDKVYQGMMTALESIGVKPIEAVGSEFDPEFHNAVMHIDDEALGENQVAEEFQKGYMYKDTVVRHSMVKVAN